MALDIGETDSDSFSYTVTDGTTTSTATVTFTIQGAAPVPTSGDDLLIGVSAGTNSLDALAGNDVMIGRVNENDTLWGNAGNDTIYGDSGYDLLIGEGGTDFIYGGNGFDVIYGDHQDLNRSGLIAEADATDALFGENGNDTIYGGFGNDPIAGFPGEDPDVAVGAGDTPDPVPENGRDVLAGGAGNDLIFGEDDDDTLTGGSGEDTLDGGVDDDSISGGADNDSLIGGQGDDTLDGGMGDDTLDGGSGANNLFGGEGDDSITGGDDDDTVIGGFGDDTISVGDGDDTVQGGAGDDSIVAGPGDDTIEGNDGEDTINGGLGDDLLSGNDDADLFQGVNGGDTVSGGAGFGPDSEDFDVLNLAGSVGNTPGAVRFAIEDTVTDSDGNGIDGSIVYYDAADAVVGEIEFTNIEEIVPCFTPGSLIATPKGERLVEELVEGDRVITRDNGIQTIRWVGQKGLNGAALHDAPHMQPILIKAGALGNGLPERDMLVSPNHRVLVASEKTSLYFEEREVLVAAKHMIDGKGVMQVEASATTYIHFMFDRHEVVLSDGAWTESFQPGDYSLKGLANEQRAEIFELFPELEQQEGLSNYEAARRTLKKHEAKLLQK